MRTSLRLAILVCVLGAAAPEFAAAQAEPSRVARDRLFFVTATAGFGDCDDVLCGPREAHTGAGLGLGIGGYVRPIPYFAAGLDLHLNLLGADHGDGRVDEGASYWLANLAVRGIVPIDRVDLWGGVGFGLAGWSYGWTKDNKDENESFSGSNLALSTGVDVELVDRWWLGGTARWAFPFWSERCDEKIEEGKHEVRCRDFETLDYEDREEATDVLWYVGVAGRFEF